ncbi:MAG: KH domain-containing protein [archaeon]
MQSKGTIVIPKNRVGVLIGQEGRSKNQIESTLNIDLNISSETGIVEIVPKSEKTDPVATLRARDIITAIGRGFSPENAFLLFDDDVVFDLIDLRETFDKNENDIRRMKGRIIGEQGKTRRIIEEMTRAHVSIFGDTVGFIGDYEAISIAREAVELILEGKQHATIYRFLRSKRREVKKKQTLELWEKPVRPP